MEQQSNISVKVSHTQKVQVQISLPFELLADIVTAADTLGETVADFLAAAVKDKLAGWFFFAVGVTHLTFNRTTPTDLNNKPNKSI